MDLKSGGRCIQTGGFSQFRSEPANMHSKYRRCWKLKFYEDESFMAFAEIYDGKKEIIMEVRLKVS